MYRSCTATIYAANYILIHSTKPQTTQLFSRFELQWNSFGCEFSSNDALEILYSKNVCAVEAKQLQTCDSTK